MDIKQLLEKMEEFTGEKVGQKPGDHWKGSDKAPPGKKLVGDSIIKDLSKGPTPKTREQELAEELNRDITPILRLCEVGIFKISLFIMGLFSK